MNRGILIVDDNTTLCKTLSDILRVRGYTPVAVHGGKEALTEIEKKVPAVALIDLKLRDISGLDLVKAIRERSPDTECIVFTGHASQASASEAVNLGVYGYLQKPYDVEQLLLTIHRAIEKREARQGLGEEARLTQVLLDSMPYIAMLIRSGTREIVTSNQAAVRAGGVSGARCFESWAQRKDPCPWCLAPAVWATGKAQRSQVEAHGGVWDIHWIPADSDLYLHYAIDISERVRAEEELRGSEERYRSIVELSPDGILTLNLLGVVTSCNRAFSELSGYAREEIEGKHFTKLPTLRLRDIPRYVGIFSSMLRGEAAKTLEFPWAHEGGTSRWAEARVGVLRKGDKLTGFQAIVRDVTERKRAEQLLGALNQAALAMEQALTPDEIFAAVGETFKQVGFACAVLSLGESQSRLSARYVTFGGQALRAIEKLAGLRLSSFSFPIDHVDVYRAVVRKRETVYISNTVDVMRQVLPAHLKELAGQLVKTLKMPRSIAAPLIVEDEVIAVLSVQSDELTEGNMPAITAFAHQVAAAWHRAQLYEQAQQEIVERQQAEEALRRRDAILKTVSYGAERFLRGEEWESHIQRVLERLGRAIGVSRAYIFENFGRGGELFMRQRFEWAISGVTAEIDNPEFQRLPYHGTGFELWIETVGKGEVLCRHTRDLPSPVRAIFDEQDILSIANVPIFVGAEWWGFMGFDECERERTWSAPEVDALKAAANTLGAAIQHQQAEEERERIRQHMQQQDRMAAIGQLAGGVAHDFNNLLTAIQGYTEFALGGLLPNDPIRADLEEVKKAAARAAGLTNQLLIFSRKQVLQLVVLDINDVIANMEQMLRRLIGEDIELCVTLSPSLGRVRADPGQMEQVILNLAVNSRDAMPQGGQLTMETESVALDEGYVRDHPEVKPGAYAMLAVSDTGVGMSEQVQSHLFEPFFTTKERGKGTGLGLATVWGIVKQSGGHIEVDSEPGAGTTFRVYLSLTEDGVEPVRREGGRDALLQGRETILLVEDEDAVRRLARRVLERQGYTVLEAHLPSQALRLSGQYDGSVSLLVTDVVMPEMGGRDMAQRLVASRPEMKVLYISGYTDDAIARHGILEPGIAYLEKPFSPEALARKVREVLDNPPEKEEVQ